MRLIRAASLAASALALAATGAVHAADAELPWAGNLGGALKEAAAAGKPVLVDFGAVWCVPCKQMDEQTYPDPRVRALADGFVLVKVDADVQVTLVERYDVAVFPTLLFLDGKGGEIGRHKGFMTAAALADTMKAVGDGYPLYAAYLPGKGDAEVAGDYLAAAGNPRGAADLYKRALKESAGDAGRHEACEMKLAGAERDAGEIRTAATIYERLSEDASDRARRGAALQALIEAQIAMGKRKDAEASYARLSREFPDLAQRSKNPAGEHASQ